jgi:hypothetical protein
LQVFQCQGNTIPKMERLSLGSELERRMRTPGHGVSVSNTQHPPEMSAICLPINWEGRSQGVESLVVSRAGSLFKHERIAIFQSEGTEDPALSISTLSGPRFQFSCPCESKRLKAFSRCHIPITSRTQHNLFRSGFHGIGCCLLVPVPEMTATILARLGHVQTACDIAQLAHRMTESERTPPTLDRRFARRPVACLGHRKPLSTLSRYWKLPNTLGG